jgi:hypothetical protein
MRGEGDATMRYAVLALALAAMSSTAHAKITELQCAASNGHQWAVSTDDQRGRATLTYYGDGTVIGDIRTAFTPDEVRMEWGDNYFFTIDRTTLRFKAGSHTDSEPMHGTCRISQRANRKF